MQAGRAPKALRATHGNYNTMFHRLLAGHGFAFETWPVLDGSLPAALAAKARTQLSPPTASETISAGPHAAAGTPAGRVAPQS